MDWLRTAGIAAVVSVLSVAGVLIYTGREDKHRSCENRHAIIEAFDIYTNALIGASRAPDDPAEQEERDRRIKAFRAQVDEELAPLEAGC